MKKLLAILLSVCMLLTTFSGLSVSAYEFIEESEITYTYDEETHTLTIEGSGDMGNYSWWSGSDGAPWCAYAKTAKKAIISEGITSIGECAFYDFVALEEIEIPDTVTCFDMHSFSGSGLKEINISKYVTDISYMTFVNCDLMQSYKVDPENENYLSKDDVLFSKDMSTLISYPLGKVEEEESYVIPNEVVTVEGYAFSRANNLSQVTLGENVKSIGDECFFNCAKLGRVNFNEGLEFIGGGAFQHCALIEEVKLPSTITKIRPLAFYDTGFYNNLENWENNMLYVGKYLLTGEYCLTEESFESGLWGVIESSYIEGAVVIKEGTELIASDAFSWFNRGSQITSISFPASLRYINEYAFYGLGITEIDLGSNVEWIDDGAFSNCKNLANIYLGSNIKRIGRYVFDETAFVKSDLYYIDGLLYKDDYLLDYKEDLPTNITVKEGTTLIADGALSKEDAYIHKLHNVSLPESLKYIGAEAFVNTNVGELTVPEGVLEIGDYAIGYNKYYDYTKEEEAYSKISDTVIEGHLNTAAESYAKKFDIEFVDLDAPEEVTFGNFTTIVDGESLVITKFIWCNPYTYDLEIPDSYGSRTIVKITSNAFGDCSLLTSITIPESITTIESGAFLNCADSMFYVTCGSEGNRYVEENNLSFTVKHSFPEEVDGVVNTCFECGITECEALGHDMHGGNCNRDGCTHSGGGADIGGGEVIIPGGDSDGPKTEDIYTYTLSGGQATITDVDYSVSGKVEIPGTLGGYPVTKIGSGAFSSSANIKEIIIPNSVKYIEEYAFAYCYYLEKLKIGSGVISIGEYAFFASNALSEIILGGKVETIGERAFDNCPVIWNVWYGKSQSDKENITIASGNQFLGYANWYYNTCMDEHEYTADCDETCNVCDWERAETVDHSYDNICDNKCNLCGFIRDTLSHDYDNSCDRDCNNCGTIRNVNHSYTNACDNSCDRCGFLRDAGHIYDNDCDSECNRCYKYRPVVHSFNAATCTTPRTCKVCNMKLGDALGHNYKNDCDSTCDRCGEKRAAKAHVYSAATCTKAKTCKSCGAISGKALGHKSDKGTVTKKATCTAAGTKTYKCTVCKSTVKTTPLAKLGHTYSNNCDKNCNRCGAKRTVKAHTYKLYVTRKATLSANGAYRYKCSTCGYITSTANVIRKATSFSLSTVAYTYDGKVKTPSVTVKDSAGKTLKKNTDYTVTYASGRINAGTYKVTIKMKGNYDGTKTLSFKIKPANVSKCSLKLSATSFAYNGKVKTPTVTVKNASGKTLKNKTDYTLTYSSGRKKVGTYKVTVKMKGNYEGTKVLTYKINPKAASVSSLTAKKGSLTVKLNRTLTESTGYQIQYATNKSFKGAKTVSVTSYKTSSKTLTGLKRNTTYYVRVRTYKTVSGTKYYSNWSTAKYKKTK